MIDYIYVQLYIDICHTVILLEQFTLLSTYQPRARCSSVYPWDTVVFHCNHSELDSSLVTCVGGGREEEGGGADSTIPPVDDSPAPAITPLKHIFPHRR